MRGTFWLNRFLVLIGIVVGTMLAEMTRDIVWLSWLSYGLEFGTESPLVLNLHVLKLTLGITVRITVSTVLFIALSLLLLKLTRSRNLMWLITLSYLFGLLFFTLFTVVLDDWIVTPILFAISSLGA